MIESFINWLREVWNHFKPVVFIYPYESAVVFRAGRFVKKLESNNWYFRIPFIDDIFTENIALDTIGIKEVNITTLDGKTLAVGCQYDIKVIDIYKALTLTNDWRTNLADITRGILSDYLEDCNWEDIRKKTTKNAIEKRLQKRAEDLGIEVNNFTFTDKAISKVLTLFKN